MLLQLRIPKRLVIENTRLQLLYNVLLIIVGLFNILTFLTHKSYSTTIPVSVDPEISLQLDFLRTEQAKGRLNSQWWRSSCEDFDRQIEPGGRLHTGYRVFEQSVFQFGASFKRLPTKCPSPCDLNHTSPSALTTNMIDPHSCAAIPNLITISSTQDVFVASFHSMWLHNTSGASFWENMNTMYPWVTHVNVEVAYKFKLTSLPRWFFWMNNVPYVDQYSAHGSSKNSWTILLDRDETPWKVFSPGAQIMVTLAEAAFLTQGHIFPESFMMNGVRSVEDMTAALLTTGLTINIRVDCYNDMGDLRLKDTVDNSPASISAIRATTNQPACKLRFLTGSNYHQRTGHASVPFHVVRGFNLKVLHSESFMRFPDMVVSAMNLASMAVLMSLPMRLITLMVMHCMGHLSVVYQKMISEDVSIPRLCAMWAVKAVELMAPWDQLSELQSSKYEDHQVGMLTHKRFTELLARATDGIHELDDTEIANIATFCFQETMREPRVGKSIKARMHASIGNLAQVFQRRSVIDLETMDRQRFISMCTSDQAIPFDCVVKLLDKDRHLSTLESFFMPRQVKKAIFDPHLLRDQSDHQSNLQQTAQKKDVDTASPEPADLNGEQVHDDHIVKLHYKSEQSGVELESIHKQLTEAMASLKVAREELQNAREEMTPLIAARTELQTARGELQSATAELQLSRTDLQEARVQLVTSRGELDECRIAMESTRMEQTNTRSQMHELVKSTSSLISREVTKPDPLMEAELKKEIDSLRSTMAERIDEAVQRLHQEGKLNRIGREGSRLSVNFDDSGPLSAESTFDPVFRDGSTLGPSTGRSCCSKIIRRRINTDLC